MIIPDSIIKQENVIETTVTALDSEKAIKQEIDDIAKKLIKSKYNIGLVVAVLHKNKTNIYSYGYADKDKETKMNENTIFGIGSNTKLLINSLALILEAKNIIDYDEEIGDILPKSINFKDPNTSQITLRQLVLHSSGFPREPNDLKTSRIMLSYICTGKNIYRHIDKEYLYAYLENFKLTKRKKQKTTYSNIGSGLLAHLLTLKTNKSLSQLAEEHLFQPLNMNNTTFTIPNQNEHLSIGYVGDFPPGMRKNKPLENWQWSDIMVGTGGAFSNAKDLLAITKAHLSLSNTHLDTIFKQSHEIFTNDGELSYTMAWQVKEFENYKTTIHYKYGVIAGFSCYVGINIKTNDAVIVLKNNFNWKDEIGHNILLKLAAKK